MQYVEAFVKLAAVDIRALTGVGHGGVEAESGLVYVAAGVVKPDHGAAGVGVVKIKGKGVEVQGLLVPVEQFVGLRQGRHLVHPGDILLLYGRSAVLLRAGHCQGQRHYGKELFHLVYLVSISLIMFWASGSEISCMAPTIGRAKRSAKSSEKAAASTMKSTMPKARPKNRPISWLII